MTTSQEVEDWRVKIKKKIWSEFAAEPNEAHGKFLMKKFDELCDTALFGISINSQTTEGTDALENRHVAEYEEGTDNLVHHYEEMTALCHHYEQRMKVVEAETIERCAKVCEVMGAKHFECPEMSEYCADAIRALSPKVERREAKRRVSIEEYFGTGRRFLKDRRKA